MPTGQPKPLKGSALREKIRTHRGWAARRILGQRPWGKQLEIEKQVFDGEHARTEVSGCVGSTKTYALAMVALVWLLAHKPARVFSLAPSFRQVDANLWGYIKKLWNDATLNGTPLHHNPNAILKVPKINMGCEPNCPMPHQHVTEWRYEGFSTDEPHNVHGLHGENDLVILDDAHGLRRELTDEIENITAGGNTKIVIAYNKMVLSGPTYDCNHVEFKHWNHVGISYEDLRKARLNGHKLDGALGADAEKRWREKYGPKSNFYRSKVLNLYPTQEADTLIPMDWIELAFDRKVKDTGDLMLGGDVASEGDDSNTRVPMRGMLVGKIDEWQEPDTMVTVGRFVAQMKDEEAHEDKLMPKSRALLFMDSCGLGGPMVNRIAEQTNKVASHHPNCLGCQVPIKVQGLNGAEAAVGRVLDGGVMRDADEVFRNLRSQMYWNLRECLNPANANLIGLTRDPDLAAQLSCIKWRVGSDGRKEVEPKVGLALSKGGTAQWGIKRRLGFSPDKADGTMCVVWGATRDIHGEYKAGPEAKEAKSQGEERFQTAPLPEDDGHLDGLSVVGALDGVE